MIKSLILACVIYLSPEQAAFYDCRMLQAGVGPAACVIAWNEIREANAGELEIATTCNQVDDGRV